MKHAVRQTNALIAAVYNLLQSARNLELVLLLNV